MLINGPPVFRFIWWESAHYLGGGISMTGERRKFSRMPMQVIDCDFVAEGLRYAGKVTQTSIEGLLVSGLDLIYLKYNQNATVIYPDHRHEGRCRNILRQADGKFQVGIERGDVERPENEDRLLLASYLKCDQHLVSCRPLGKTREGRFVIKLFSGAEFATDRENLVSLTVKERMAQLDIATSEAAAQVYGVARPDVLDFEFGNPVPPSSV